MANTPSVKQYIFLRGRVPNPIEMLEDDRIVTSNVSPETLKRRLERNLTPEGLTDYAKDLSDAFKQIVEAGSISDGAHLNDVVNSTLPLVESYWGIKLGFPVQILSADDILEAERAYVERLNKELGTASNPKKIKSPVLPSPSFLDHLEGKMVLSDKYIILDSKGSSSTVSGNIYYTGGAKPMFYLWDEGVLKTVLVYSMGNFASRVLRGETREDYLKMLRDMPEVAALTSIPSIISAANSYALPKVLREGGVPVLYRRILDIFSRDETQMFYVAMKALADDMGIKTACLFDSFHITRTQEGPVVAGFLWNTHPNYEKKDAIIRDATGNLKYKSQSATIPEAQFRPLRG